MQGYCGKLLFVDLTLDSVEERPITELIYRNFIGGTGLGAKVIYENMRPNIDPLGPENILGFVPGLLTGTKVPMASKCLVLTKSPLTNTWGDSNTGGLFGQELKAAGYDAIFFVGVSPKPVYLWIDNNKAELRDAAHLWGKDTFETEEMLYRKIGDRKAAIARIGPAGEVCSLIASIVTDRGRVAGRSGVGAVMGSKRLKAVAVRGTNKPKIADIQRFNKLRKDALETLRELDSIPYLKSIKHTGTCGGTLNGIVTGLAPIKNWAEIGEKAFPEYSKVGSDEILRYQLNKSGCGHCPINCGGTVAVTSGSYITKGRKPEYETVVAFGPMCLNSKVESIIKANEICDRFGLDTISAGTVISFAMECWERGLIQEKDTGGLQLNWGNHKTIIALLEQIVRRQGFGDVLADGVAIAAEHIGQGSERYAVHVGGQEPGFLNPRMSPFRGLDEISNATPGRHMPPGASIRLEREGVLGAYTEITAPNDEDEYERRGKIHAIGSAYSQIFSDSGLCLFANSGGSQFPLVEFIGAVTGWDFTIAEAITTGKRIVTLRQAFNFREGVRPKDFSLPDRIPTPPAAGSFLGRNIDFEKLRVSYYKAMDWDAESGCPSQHCLAELGLQEVVSALSQT